MKLRTRQMPNGLWICEGRRWWQRVWRAVGFREYDTKLAIERGARAKTIELLPPGDPHYVTCWHIADRFALQVMRDAESLLGREVSEQPIEAPQQQFWAGKRR